MGFERWDWDHVHISVYLVLRNIYINIIGMQSELDGIDDDHSHTTTQLNNTKSSTFCCWLFYFFIYAFLRTKSRRLAFSRQLYYSFRILIIDVTCYLTTEISRFGRPLRCPLLTGYIPQSAIFRLTI